MMHVEARNSRSLAPVNTMADGRLGNVRAVLFDVRGACTLAPDMLTKQMDGLLIDSERVSGPSAGP